jgi:RNA polymerase-binding transcription factor DksA
VATARKATKPSRRAAKSAPKAARASRKPAKAARKPAKLKKAARKPARASRKPAKKAVKPKKATRKPARARKPAKASRKPTRKPAKAKKATRKPVKARKPARASRKPARKPSKAVRKPAKAVRKPAKAARKPTRKNSVRSPSRRRKPVSILAALATPALPAPLPEGVTPRREAPRGFQREHKKWLDRLIALRHRLLADGHVLEEEGLHIETRVDGAAENGAEGYEEETTLALLENNSDALREVDEAIRRIEVLTYGRCQECQKMIPKGRLGVLPHARHCIECQSELERIGY